MTTVAKYCNERVSVCLFVRKHISQIRCAHARSLPHCFCMLSITVAQSSSGRVTKFQGEGAVFFPIDNVLYSVAFWTHTKTAEPIEMSFELMTRIFPKCHVLDGAPIPQGECAILGENVPAHCKVMGVGHYTVRCAITAHISTCRFEDSVGPRNHVLDGVQIPKGKGQFSGVVRAVQKHHACNLYQFLCMLPIAVDGGLVLRRGDEIWRGRGNFGGFLPHLKALAIFAAAVAFAAKGIMQSPIMSCSRRDHSVCTSSAGDASCRPQRGWWDCTAQAKYNYYCLVRPVSNYLQWIFYSLYVADDFKETVGIPRIIEALSCHSWPNLIMKGRCAHMLSETLSAIWAVVDACADSCWRQRCSKQLRHFDTNPLLALSVDEEQLHGVVPEGNHVLQTCARDEGSWVLEKKVRLSEDWMASLHGVYVLYAGSWFMARLVQSCPLLLMLLL